MIKSFGKGIELIPIIEDPSLNRHMLPPVVWHVPNELIGFVDEHRLAGPFTIISQERSLLPSSYGSRAAYLSWMVRILEDHPAGTVESVPIGNIDRAAVDELLAALTFERSKR